MFAKTSVPVGCTARATTRGGVPLAPLRAPQKPRCLSMGTSGAESKTSEISIASPRIRVYQQVLTPARVYARSSLRAYRRGGWISGANTGHRRYARAALRTGLDRRDTM